MVAHIVKLKKMCKILVVHAQRKRHFGMPKRKCETNIQRIIRK